MDSIRKHLSVFFSGLLQGLSFVVYKNERIQPPDAREYNQPFWTIISSREQPESRHFALRCDVNDFTQR
jgi:hypothetical protein